MKKINTIIFLILPLELLAQTVISTIQTQIVYLNVSNEILVSSSDFESSQLAIETDNGIISKRDGRYFWVPVDSTKQDAYLKLYNLKTKSLIKTRKFHLKKIGIPEVEINTRGLEGEPNWYNFKCLKLSFGVFDNEFNLDSLSRIDSFRISLQDSSLLIDSVFSFIGSTVSNSFTEFFGKCRSGTKIRIFDIYITAKWIKNDSFFYDDFMWMYHPLEYTLK